MKISLIFILLLAACTTEPVEIHDDNAVLQKLFNDPTIECGELPDSICVLKNGRISELNLFNMDISKEIPDDIGSLSELTQLGLKSTNLNGGIPESIGNLSLLTQLSLSDNHLGCLEFVGDTCKTFCDGENGCSRTIPESIGKLKELRRLDISHNQLNGSIPGTISELTALHTFLADTNNLNGTLPDDICTIYPQFIEHDLSGNQFCPPLPSCIDTPDDIGFQNCDTSCGSGNAYLNGYCYSQSDLDVLQDFIYNANSLNMIMDTDTLEGVQPLELGFQEWQSGRLKTLDCYWDTVSCNLSTEFPVNIINLDSLKYLDLQNNALTGAIPDEISNLSALEEVDLQDNNLSGYLSENLCIDDTTVWIDINLKNNQFCPCYPKCIENNIGTQETSGCSYCNDGYTQICDDLPESVTIQEGDSLCFNTDNLAVLQAFIDNSINTLDTLDYELMDTNYNGTIESLSAVDTNSFEQDATGDLAIETGSGNGWYNYCPPGVCTPVGISPLNNIIVVRTRDNKYAKVKIISYYKDGDNTSDSRYYTFDYVYQPNDGLETF